MSNYAFALNENVRIGTSNCHHIFMKFNKREVVMVFTVMIFSNEEYLFRL